MKTIAIVLLLLFPLSASSETPTDKQHLFLMKLAGICQSIVLMAEFQKSAKMPGGSKFIEHFYYSEITRLGVTPKEFTYACEQAVTVHNTTREAIEEPQ